MERCFVGVLGGMGPAATVDFMQKVIAGTDAADDQSHVPLLVASLPDIPDRSAAILNGSESPLTTLIRYRRLLEDAGVGFIVMPCNTAHYWFDQLSQDASVPLLSIIDAVVAEVIANGYQKLGVLATTATIEAGLYQKKLDDHDVKYVTLDEKRQQQVMESVYCLKAGDCKTAVAKMENEVQFLKQQGVDAIILGCTEIPVILQQAVAQAPGFFIDSNAALARSTIRMYEQRVGKKLLKETSKKA